MTDWLKTMSFKNGDIPLVNDSANGITFSTSQLFSFAATIQLPKPKNISLHDCGYRKYAMNDYECIVDAGGITASWQPGHSHADALSFVLYYKNIPVIVDTGTSTYEATERRTYERSTTAHNTVTINDASQYELWDIFRVGRRAGVKIIDETSSALTAYHTGYKKFKVIHKRTFSFGDKSIKISDDIAGPQKISAKSYLHFHPDCIVKKEKENIIVDGVVISLRGAEQAEIKSYKFASGFNAYMDGQVLAVAFGKHLETSIYFL
jgi:hypothetical protein